MQLKEIGWTYFCTIFIYCIHNINHSVYTLKVMQLLTTKILIKNFSKKFTPIFGFGLKSKGMSWQLSGNPLPTS